MRIESDQTFADVPAMRVRDLIRNVGPNGLFGVEFAESVLGTSEKQSKILIDELERRGFIERDCSTSEWWRTTLKGSALALATAAKPIRRHSAEDILKRFLKRVLLVRDNAHYLLRVEQVVLFGSMVTESQTVNDIDLGISLQRKEPDDDIYKERADQLRRAAAASGRRFPRDADWFAWPATHVKLFLKSRSRALSIHPLDDWVRNQPGCHTIYVHHDDALGQQLLFDTDGLQ